jgi:5-carboxymethyl-2-hydroxymuconate isomerase
MPHLTLEYSSNLPAPIDHQALLAELHAALERLGAFQLAEIKSRAIPHDIYRVGGGDPQSVFAHLTVAILSGRELALRQQLSAELLAILRQAFAPAWNDRPCDLTVELREMPRDTYSKAMNGLGPDTMSRTA